MHQYNQILSKQFFIIKSRLFDPLELKIGKIKNEKHMLRGSRQRRSSQANCMTQGKESFEKQFIILVANEIASQKLNFRRFIVFIEALY